MSKVDFSEVTKGSGVGILTVLQLIFLVLKLTKLIAWPWVIVLIPLWIQLGLAVLLIVLIALLFLLEWKGSKKDGGSRK